jgi:hypothetical protein
VEFLLPFSSKSCVLCFISRNIAIKILRILILTVVLYGYGTWSVRVREENRLRVCENRVLRNMFWTKWEEVNGGRMKLLSENLDDSYSLSNILRVMESVNRWAGHMACVGGKKDACRLLVGKSKENT